MSIYAVILACTICTAYSPGKLPIEEHNNALGNLADKNSTDNTDNKTLQNAEEIFKSTQQRLQDLPAAESKAPHEGEKSPSGIAPATDDKQYVSNQVNSNSTTKNKTQNEHSESAYRRHGSLLNKRRTNARTHFPAVLAATSDKQDVSNQVDSNNTTKNDTQNEHSESTYRRHGSLLIEETHHQTRVIGAQEHSSGDHSLRPSIVDSSFNSEKDPTEDDHSVVGEIHHRTIKRVMTKQRPSLRPDLPSPNALVEEIHQRQTKHITTSREPSIQHDLPSPSSIISLSDGMDIPVEHDTVVQETHHRTVEHMNSAKKHPVLENLPTPSSISPLLRGTDIPAESDNVVVEETHNRKIKHIKSDRELFPPHDRTNPSSIIPLLDGRDIPPEGGKIVVEETHNREITHIKSDREPFPQHHVANPSSLEPSLDGSDIPSDLDNTVVEETNNRNVMEIRKPRKPFRPHYKSNPFSLNPILDGKDIRPEDDNVVVEKTHNREVNHIRNDREPFPPHDRANPSLINPLLDGMDITTEEGNTLGDRKLFQPFELPNPFSVNPPLHDRNIPPEGDNIVVEETHNRKINHIESDRELFPPHDRTNPSSIIPVLDGRDIPQEGGKIVVEETHNREITHIKSDRELSPPHDLTNPSLINPSLDGKDIVPEEENTTLGGITPFRQHDVTNPSSLSPLLNGRHIRPEGDNTVVEKSQLRQNEYIMGPQESSKWPDLLNPTSIIPLPNNGEILPGGKISVIVRIRSRNLEDTMNAPEHSSPDDLPNPSSLIPWLDGRDIPPEEDSELIEEAHNRRFDYIRKPRKPFRPLELPNPYSPNPLLDDRDIPSDLGSRELVLPSNLPNPLLLIFHDTIRTPEHPWNNSPNPTPHHTAVTHTFDDERDRPTAYKPHHPTGRPITTVGEETEFHGFHQEPNIPRHPTDAIGTSPLFENQPHRPTDQPHVTDEGETTSYIYHPGPTFPGPDSANPRVVIPPFEERPGLVLPDVPVKVPPFHVHPKSDTSNPNAISPPFDNNDRMTGRPITTVEEETHFHGIHQEPNIPRHPTDAIGTSPLFENQPHRPTDQPHVTDVGETTSYIYHPGPTFPGPDSANPRVVIPPFEVRPGLVLPDVPVKVPPFHVHPKSDTSNPNAISPPFDNNDRMAGRPITTVEEETHFHGIHQEPNIPRHPTDAIGTSPLFENQPHRPTDQPHVTDEGETTSYIYHPGPTFPGPDSADPRVVIPPFEERPGLVLPDVPVKVPPFHVHPKSDTSNPNAISPPFDNNDRMTGRPITTVEEETHFHGIHQEPNIPRHPTDAIGTSPLFENQPHRPADQPHVTDEGETTSYIYHPGPTFPGPDSANPRVVIPPFEERPGLVLPDVPVKVPPFHVHPKSDTSNPNAISPPFENNDRMTGRPITTVEEETHFHGIHQEPNIPRHPTDAIGTSPLFENQPHRPTDQPHVTDVAETTSYIYHPGPTFPGPDSANPRVVIPPFEVRPGLVLPDVPVKVPPFHVHPKSDTSNPNAISPPFDNNDRMAGRPITTVEEETQFHGIHQEPNIPRHPTDAIGTSPLFENQPHRPTDQPHVTDVGETTSYIYHPGPTFPGTDSANPRVVIPPFEERPGLVLPDVPVKVPPFHVQPISDTSNPNAISPPFDNNDRMTGRPITTVEEETHFRGIHQEPNIPRHPTDAIGTSPLFENQPHRPTDQPHVTDVGETTSYIYHPGPTFPGTDSANPRVVIPPFGVRPGLVLPDVPVKVPPFHVQPISDTSNPNAISPPFDNNDRMTGRPITTVEEETHFHGIQQEPNIPRHPTDAIGTSPLFENQPHRPTDQPHVTDVAETTSYIYHPGPTFPGPDSANPRVVIPPFEVRPGLVLPDVPVKVPPFHVQPISDTSNPNAISPPFDNNDRMTGRPITTVEEETHFRGIHQEPNIPRHPTDAIGTSPLFENQPHRPTDQPHVTDVGETTSYIYHPGPTFPGTDSANPRVVIPPFEERPGLVLPDVPVKVPPFHVQPISDTSNPNAISPPFDNNDRMTGRPITTVEEETHFRGIHQEPNIPRHPTDAIGTSPLFENQPHRPTDQPHVTDVGETTSYIYHPGPTFPGTDSANPRVVIPPFEERPGLVLPDVPVKVPPFHVQPISDTSNPNAISPPFDNNDRMTGRPITTVEEETHFHGIQQEPNIPRHPTDAIGTSPLFENQPHRPTDQPHVTDVAETTSYIYHPGPTFPGPDSANPRVVIPPFEVRPGLVLPDVPVKVPPFHVHPKSDTSNPNAISPPFDNNDRMAGRPITTVEEETQFHGIHQEPNIPRHPTDAIGTSPLFENQPHRPTDQPHVTDVGETTSYIYHPGPTFPGTDSANPRVVIPPFEERPGLVLPDVPVKVPPFHVQPISDTSNPNAISPPFDNNDRMTGRPITTVEEETHFRGIHQEPNIPRHPTDAIGTSPLFENQPHRPTDQPHVTDVGETTSYIYHPGPTFPGTDSANPRVVIPPFEERPGLVLPDVPVKVPPFHVQPISDTSNPNAISPPFDNNDRMTGRPITTVEEETHFRGIHQEPNIPRHPTDAIGTSPLFENQPHRPTDQPHVTDVGETTSYIYHPGPTFPGPDSANPRVVILPGLVLPDVPVKVPPFHVHPKSDTSNPNAISPPFDNNDRMTGRPITTVEEETHFHGIHQEPNIPRHPTDAIGTSPLFENQPHRPTDQPHVTDVGETTSYIYHPGPTFPGTDSANPRVVIPPFEVRPGLVLPDVPVKVPPFHVQPKSDTSNPNAISPPFDNNDRMTGRPITTVEEETHFHGIHQEPNIPRHPTDAISTSPLFENQPHRPTDQPHVTDVGETTSYIYHPGPTFPGPDSANPRVVIPPFDVRPGLVLPDVPVKVPPFHVHPKSDTSNPNAISPPFDNNDRMTGRPITTVEEETHFHGIHQEPNIPRHPTDAIGTSPLFENQPHRPTDQPHVTDVGETTSYIYHPGPTFPGTDSANPRVVIPPFEERPGLVLPDVPVKVPPFHVQPISDTSNPNAISPPFDNNDRMTGRPITTVEEETHFRGIHQEPNIPRHPTDAIGTSPLFENQPHRPTDQPHVTDVGETTSYIYHPGPTFPGTDSANPRVVIPPFEERPGLVLPDVPVKVPPFHVQPISDTSNPNAISPPFDNNDRMTGRPITTVEEETHFRGIHQEPNIPRHPTDAIGTSPLFENQPHRPTDQPHVTDVGETTSYIYHPGPTFPGPDSANPRVVILPGLVLPDVPVKVPPFHVHPKSDTSNPNAISPPFDNNDRMTGRPITTVEEETHFHGIHQEPNIPRHPTDAIGTSPLFENQPHRPTDQPHVTDVGETTSYIYHPGPTFPGTDSANPRVVIPPFEVRPGLVLPDVPVKVPPFHVQPKSDTSNPNAISPPFDNNDRMTGRPITTVEEETHFHGIHQEPNIPRHPTDAISTSPLFENQPHRPTDQPHVTDVGETTSYIYHPGPTFPGPDSANPRVVIPPFDVRPGLVLPDVPVKVPPFHVHPKSDTSNPNAISPPFDNNDRMTGRPITTVEEETHFHGIHQEPNIPRHPTDAISTSPLFENQPHRPTDQPHVTDVGETTSYIYHPGPTFPGTDSANPRVVIPPFEVRPGLVLPDVPVKVPPFHVQPKSDTSNPNAISPPFDNNDRMTGRPITTVEEETHFHGIHQEPNIPRHPTDAISTSPLFENQPHRPTDQPHVTDVGETTSYIYHPGPTFPGPDSANPRVVIPPFEVRPGLVLPDVPVKVPPFHVQPKSDTSNPNAISPPFDNNDRMTGRPITTVEEETHFHGIHQEPNIPRHPTDAISTSPLFENQPHRPTDQPHVTDVGETTSYIYHPGPTFPGPDSANPRVVIPPFDVRPGLVLPDVPVKVPPFHVHPKSDTSNPNAISPPFDNNDRMTGRPITTVEEETHFHGIHQEPNIPRHPTDAISTSPLFENQPHRPTDQPHVTDVGETTSYIYHPGPTFPGTDSANPRVVIPPFEVRPGLVLPDVPVKVPPFHVQPKSDTSNPNAISPPFDNNDRMTGRPITTVEEETHFHGIHQEPNIPRHPTDAISTSPLFENQPHRPTDQPHVTDVGETTSYIYHPGPTFPGPDSANPRVVIPPFEVRPGLVLPDVPVKVPPFHVQPKSDTSNPNAISPPFDNNDRMTGRPITTVEEETHFHGIHQEPNIPRHPTDAISTSPLFENQPHRPTDQPHVTDVGETTSYIYHPGPTFPGPDSANPRVVIPPFDVRPGLVLPDVPVKVPPFHVHPKSDTSNPNAISPPFDNNDRMTGRPITTVEEETHFHGIHQEPNIPRHPTDAISTSPLFENQPHRPTDQPHVTDVGETTSYIYHPGPTFPGTDSANPRVVIPPFEVRPGLVLPDVPVKVPPFHVHPKSDTSNPNAISPPFDNNDRMTGRPITTVEEETHFHGIHQEPNIPRHPTDAISTSPLFENQPHRPTDQPHVTDVGETTSYIYHPGPTFPGTDSANPRVVIPPFEVRPGLVLPDVPVKVPPFHVQPKSDTSNPNAISPPFDNNDRMTGRPITTVEEETHFHGIHQEPNIPRHPTDAISTSPLFENQPHRPTDQPHVTDVGETTSYIYHPGPTFPGPDSANPRVVIPPFEVRPGLVLPDVPVKVPPFHVQPKSDTSNPNAISPPFDNNDRMTGRPITTVEEETHFHGIHQEPNIPRHPTDAIGTSPLFENQPHRPTDQPHVTDVGETTSYIYHPGPTFPGTDSANPRVVIPPFGVRPGLVLPDVPVKVPPFHVQPISDTSNPNAISPPFDNNDRMTGRPITTVEEETHFHGIHQEPNIPRHPTDAIGTSPLFENQPHRPTDQPHVTDVGETTSYIYHPGPTFPGTDSANPRVVIPPFGVRPGLVLPDVPVKVPPFHVQPISDTSNPNAISPPFDNNDRMTGRPITTVEEETHFHGIHQEPNIPRHPTDAIGETTSYIYHPGPTFPGTDSANPRVVIPPFGVRPGLVLPDVPVKVPPFHVQPISDTSNPNAISPPFDNNDRMTGRPITTVEEETHFHGIHQEPNIPRHPTDAIGTSPLFENQPHRPTDQPHVTDVGETTSYIYHPGPTFPGTDSANPRVVIPPFGVRPGLVLPDVPVKVPPFHVQPISDTSNPNAISPPFDNNDRMTGRPITTVEEETHFHGIHQEPNIPRHPTDAIGTSPLFENQPHRPTDQPHVTDVGETTSYIYHPGPTFPGTDSANPRFVIPPFGVRPGLVLPDVPVKVPPFHVQPISDTSNPNAISPPFDNNDRMTGRPITTVEEETHFHGIHQEPNIPRHPTDAIGTSPLFENQPHRPTDQPHVTDVGETTSYIYHPGPTFPGTDSANPRVVIPPFGVRPGLVLPDVPVKVPPFHVQPISDTSNPNAISPPFDNNDHMTGRPITTVEEETHFHGIHQEPNIPRHPTDAIGTSPLFENQPHRPTDQPHVTDVGETTSYIYHPGPTFPGTDSANPRVVIPPFGVRPGLVLPDVPVKVPPFHVQPISDTSNPNAISPPFDNNDRMTGRPITTVEEETHFHGIHQEPNIPRHPTDAIGTSPLFENQSHRPTDQPHVTDVGETTSYIYHPGPTFPGTDSANPRVVIPPFGVRPGLVLPDVPVKVPPFHVQPISDTSNPNAISPPFDNNDRMTGRPITTVEEETHFHGIHQEPNIPRHPTDAIGTSPLFENQPHRPTDQPHVTDVGETTSYIYHPGPTFPGTDSANPRVVIPPFGVRPGLVLPDVPVKVPPFHVQPISDTSNPNAISPPFDNNDRMTGRPITTVEEETHFHGIHQEPNIPRHPTDAIGTSPLFENQPHRPTDQPHVTDVGETTSYIYHPGPTFPGTDSANPRVVIPPFGVRPGLVLPDVPVKVPPFHVQPISDTSNPNAISPPFDNNDRMTGRPITTVEEETHFHGIHQEPNIPRHPTDAIGTSPLFENQPHRPTDQPHVTDVGETTSYIYHPGPTFPGTDSANPRVVIPPFGVRPGLVLPDVPVKVPPFHVQPISDTSNPNAVSPPFDNNDHMTGRPITTVEEETHFHGIHQEPNIPRHPTDAIGTSPLFENQPHRPTDQPHVTDVGETTSYIYHPGPTFPGTDSANPRVVIPPFGVRPGLVLPDVPVKVPPFHVQPISDTSNPNAISPPFDNNDRMTGRPITTVEEETHFHGIHQEPNIPRHPTDAIGTSPLFENQPHRPTDQPHVTDVGETTSYIYHPGPTFPGTDSANPRVVIPPFGVRPGLVLPDVPVKVPPFHVQPISDTSNPNAISPPFDNNDRMTGRPITTVEEETHFHGIHQEPNIPRHPTDAIGTSPLFENQPHRPTDQPHVTDVGETTSYIYHPGPTFPGTDSANPRVVIPPFGVRPGLVLPDVPVKVPPFHVQPISDTSNPNAISPPFDNNDHMTGRPITTVEEETHFHGIHQEPNIPRHPTDAIGTSPLFENQPHRPTDQPHVTDVGETTSYIYHPGPTFPGTDSANPRVVIPPFGVRPGLVLPDVPVKVPPFHVQPISDTSNPNAISPPFDNNDRMTGRPITTVEEETHFHGIHQEPNIPRHPTDAIGTSPLFENQPHRPTDQPHVTDVGETTSYIYHPGPTFPGTDSANPRVVIPPFGVRPGLVLPDVPVKVPPFHVQPISDTSNPNAISPPFDNNDHMTGRPITTVEEETHFHGIHQEPNIPRHPTDAIGTSPLFENQPHRPTDQPHVTDVGETTSYIYHPGPTFPGTDSANPRVVIPPFGVRPGLVLPDVPVKVPPFHVQPISDTSNPNAISPPFDNNDRMTGRPITTVEEETHFHGIHQEPNIPRHPTDAIGTSPLFENQPHRPTDQPHVTDVGETTSYIYHPGPTFPGTDSANPRVVIPPFGVRPGLVLPDVPVKVPPFHVQPISDTSNPNAISPPFDNNDRMTGRPITTVEEETHFHGIHQEPNIPRHPTDAIGTSPLFENQPHRPTDQPHVTDVGETTSYIYHPGPTFPGTDSANPRVVIPPFGVRPGLVLPDVPVKVPPFHVQPISDTSNPNAVSPPFDNNDRMTGRPITTVEEETHFHGIHQEPNIPRHPTDAIGTSPLFENQPHRPTDQPHVTDVGETTSYIYHPGPTFPGTDSANPRVVIPPFEVRPGLVLPDVPVKVPPFHVQPISDTSNPNAVSPPFDNNDRMTGRPITTVEEETHFHGIHQEPNIPRHPTDAIGTSPLFENQPHRPTDQPHVTDVGETTSYIYHPGPTFPGPDSANPRVVIPPFEVRPGLVLPDVPVKVPPFHVHPKSDTSNPNAISPPFDNNDRMTGRPITTVEEETHFHGFHQEPNIPRHPTDAIGTSPLFENQPHRPTAQPPVTDEGETTSYIYHPGPTFPGPDSANPGVVVLPGLVLPDVPVKVPPFHVHPESDTTNPGAISPPFDDNDHTTGRPITTEEEEMKLDTYHLEPNIPRQDPNDATGISPLFENQPYHPTDQPLVTEEEVKNTHRYRSKISYSSYHQSGPEAIISTAFIAPLEAQPGFVFPDLAVHIPPFKVHTAPKFTTPTVTSPAFNNASFHKQPDASSSAAIVTPAYSVDPVHSTTDLIHSEVIHGMLRQFPLNRSAP
ncbi:hypothetical protein Q1695_015822 [Nippostrongylus brasiliensis]|nr:hypothetical protein Q1695_015822 [Nippostrongylus brasiliensis]